MQERLHIYMTTIEITAYETDDAGDETYQEPQPPIGSRPIFFLFFYLLFLCCWSRGYLRLRFRGEKWFGLRSNRWFRLRLWNNRWFGFGLRNDNSFGLRLRSRFYYGFRLWNDYRFWLGLKSRLYDSSSNTTPSLSTTVSNCEKGLFTSSFIAVSGVNVSF